MKKLLESLKELFNNFVKPGSEIDGLSLADGEVDLSKLDISPEMRQAFEESENTMKKNEERLAYIPEEHQKPFKPGKQVSNTQEGKAPITQTQPEKDEIER